MGDTNTEELLHCAGCEYEFVHNGWLKACCRGCKRTPEHRGKVDKYSDDWGNRSFSTKERNMVVCALEREEKLAVERLEKIEKSVDGLLNTYYSLRITQAVDSDLKDAKIRVEFLGQLSKKVQKMRISDGPSEHLIRITRGVIVILRDGTILNFPSGNDDEYQAWLKTDESKQIAPADLLTAAKACELVDDSLTFDASPDGLKVRDRCVEIRDGKPAIGKLLVSVDFSAAEVNMQCKKPCLSSFSIDYIKAAAAALSFADKIQMHMRNECLVIFEAVINDEKGMPCGTVCYAIAPRTISDSTGGCKIDKPKQSAEIKEEAPALKEGETCPK